MNYWKVSGLRVSHDGVVTVDWIDDSGVEDVTLREHEGREGGLDKITLQIFTSQYTP